jgi:hypothetical protein
VEIRKEDLFDGVAGKELDEAEQFAGFSAAGKV